jgi:hypothetical protein
MPLSATAEGSASAGTCSLTDACHAGPNKAIPLPMMKQATSRRTGVTKPSHARTESEIEPANAIDRATSPTIRRSNMSAIAPAGVETSATGSINDVWTRATISADEVICVIVQAAPTPRTKMPRLDSRLAVHMRRNTAWRKGEKMPRADGARLFDGMRIIPANFARQAYTNAPFAGILGPADYFSLRTISKT